MRLISFTEPQLREAIAESKSFSEAMRRIGLRPAGGNHGTIKKYAALWGISTEHFGPGGRAGYPRGGVTARPLEEILVVGSTYSRTNLKARLYKEGLKKPECEICGQSEVWNGKRISLILDHVNGDAADNRIENLQIVCPNCNAGLDTHCGRNKSRGRPPIACEQCGEKFRAKHRDQRFCSQSCAAQHNAPATRRAERPSLDKLLDLVDALGYEAVGRVYGVSGTAIRKWIKAYGEVPPPGRGREFNPPPRPHRLLTEGQAREALQMIAEGTSMYAVAKLMDVDQKVIQALRHGKTYREISRPWEDVA